jgi:hypothetical protein
MDEMKLPPLPEPDIWPGFFTPEKMRERDRQIVELCAQIAEQICSKHWQDYKRGPHRADLHYQGMSDGAEEVRAAISALLEDTPKCGEGAKQ